MQSVQPIRRSWALGAFLLLTGCVTINVYFPAAEAERAAREFVEKVITPEPAQEEKPAPRETPPALGLWLGWLISDAHAQTADIELSTPAIRSIQQRMAERFRTRLAAAFDAGALGFSRDGLVVLRDASKVGLRERAALNQAVAEENQDRNTLYREVAVANGHPEWETQIRETFARQWIEAARPGWWYQDAGGNWVQK